LRWADEAVIFKKQRGLGKKGLVLVAVLWIVMLLTVMVATLGRNSRLDMKVRQITTETLRCKWACRAGIETAVGVLNEDPRESDNLLDLWSDNDEDFNDIMLEGCWYNVRVIDESSKLNINTVTKEQLLGLPYMEEYIADAIIDWRDNDDSPSGEGVEAGYYDNLPFPYRIRNGSLKTVRELLLVKDVTEELFYGEDTNLNDELDANERDGDENPPWDDGDDELDRGWISYLTCYSYDKNVDASGSNRVNINEANERQLQNSLGIPQSQAQWIVERRGNNGLNSIADLIDNSTPQQPPQSSGRGSNQAQPLDLQTFYDIADRITVDSGNQIAGRVNINTAPRDVLVALLGGEAADEETADNIVAYRVGLLDGMQSIAELLQAGLVDMNTFKEIANSITTRSDVYTIRCVATADRGGNSGMRLQTEAVIDRSSSPCRILYWYEGASN